MEKKYKELHFKRAVLHGTTQTLQELLEKQSKAVPLPDQRIEALGLNGSEARVILHYRHRSSVLCATMASFEKGALQPILGMKPDAPDWSIELSAPVSLPGATDTEFLDGYLFLGIWKNNVVFLPSRSCTSKDLEDHLNHILREIRDNLFLTLDDRPTREVREKSFENIRSLSVNTTLGAATEPVLGHPNGENHVETDSENVKTSRFRFVGQGIEGLKSIFESVGGKFPEDILTDGNFNPEDVTIKILVSCPKRKMEMAGPVMDVMANAFRHVETDVVKFKFQDGTQLSGTQLKSKKQIRIDCVGSMPVTTQVEQEIESYLRELIEQGTITEEL